MQYLMVNNWEKFQHYKGRTPPWIKLHRDLLRDYHFNRLQDASKLHLILIWLLASQLDNKIPDDASYIQQLIYVKEKVDLKELIDKGFLVRASVLLASCKQVATLETDKETDKEAEEETETEVGDFENFWQVYGYKVGKVATEKAYKKIIKKGVKHEEIINGVKQYQSYCQRTGTSERYIKRPTTYLNGEHWHDEYPAIVGKDGEYAAAAARGQARAENPDF